jgi:ubiquinone/menaquinone biosynthesis C-methylase UbiE
MATRQTPYPDAAVAWMVGPEPMRVLDLGTGRGGFASMLRDAGHEIFCIDRTVELIAGLPARLGTQRHVVGRIESLPFLSCHFDVVTAAQTLHHFPPGLALSEIARVLKPGGHLAIAYNTRDDTVPWVRRLIALMREADPESMRGEYGEDSVEKVAESPYFGLFERRNFRNWMPITRDGLISMVERRPAVAQLDPVARERLLHAVGALYDSSARRPDPLMLPFQTSCWRVEVDHSTLVIADDFEDVLRIKL